MKRNVIIVMIQNVRDVIKMIIQMTLICKNVPMMNIKNKKDKDHVIHHLKHNVLIIY